MKIISPLIALELGVLKNTEPQYPAGKIYKECYKVVKYINEFEKDKVLEDIHSWIEERI